MEKIRNTYNTKNYVKALDQLNAYLKANGLELEALKYQILTLDKLQKYDECRQAFELYLILNPLDCDIIRLKIQFLKKEKKYLELNDYLDYIEKNMPIELDSSNIFNF